MINMGNWLTNNTKRYVALLTQSGTNAPVAIVLENTIGSIVWTYNDVGGYLGTLSGAFTTNKTCVLCTPDPTAPYKGKWKDINIIEVRSYNNLIVPANDRLDNSYIEIMVYA